MDWYNINPNYSDTYVNTDQLYSNINSDYLRIRICDDLNTECMKSFRELLYLMLLVEPEHTIPILDILENEMFVEFISPTYLYVQCPQSPKLSLIDLSRSLILF